MDTLFDDPSGNIIGWICVLTGAFAICGAVFQWDFFMNPSNQTSRALRDFLGASGYRIIQTVLGTAMIALGCLLNFSQ
ncbi:Imm17 family immunity protein [Alienimonas chondri]|uniref:Imm17 family immunity protein n=1 Tax=Alienimonas chondri TaxID=2681879 RepID=UPI001487FF67|nr:Imm17 family immunity protein [Alienimonas chondri]